MHFKAFGVVFILVKKEIGKWKGYEQRFRENGSDIRIDNLKNSNNLKMDLHCFCIYFSLILEKCNIVRNEQMERVWYLTRRSGKNMYKNLLFLEGKEHVKNGLSDEAVFRQLSDICQAVFRQPLVSFQAVFSLLLQPLFTYKGGPAFNAPIYKMVYIYKLFLFSTII